MSTPRHTLKQAQLGDLFTYHEARMAGLSNRTIYSMRDGGDIIPLGGGLYRRSDAPPADLDLIEIAERVSRVSLCLETALARHGMVDDIPIGIDIAVPRGAHLPRLTAPVIVHTFDSTTFDVGRETIDVGGRKRLGVYSPERCIVDMIRLRHARDSAQAWESLRNWLALPGNNPGRLIRMAKSFHGAEAPLRQALEILL